MDKEQKKQQKLNEMAQQCIDLRNQVSYKQEQICINDETMIVNEVREKLYKQKNKLTSVLKNQQKLMRTKGLNNSIAKEEDCQPVSNEVKESRERRVSNITADIAATKTGLAEDSRNDAGTDNNVNVTDNDGGSGGRSSSYDQSNIVFSDGDGGFNNPNYDGSGGYDDSHQGGGGFYSGGHRNRRDGDYRSGNKNNPMIINTYADDNCGGGYRSGGDGYYSSGGGYYSSGGGYDIVGHGGRGYHSISGGGGRGGDGHGGGYDSVGHGGRGYHSISRGDYRHGGGYDSVGRGGGRGGVRGRGYRGRGGGCRGSRGGGSRGRGYRGGDGGYHGGSNNNNNNNNNMIHTPAQIWKNEKKRSRDKVRDNLDDLPALKKQQMSNNTAYGTAYGTVYSQGDLNMSLCDLPPPMENEIEMDDTDKERLITTLDGASEEDLNEDFDITNYPSIKLKIKKSKKVKRAVETQKQKAIPIWRTELTRAKAKKENLMGVVKFSSTYGLNQTAVSDAFQIVYKCRAQEYDFKRYCKKSDIKKANKKK